MEEEGNRLTVVSLPSRGAWIEIESLQSLWPFGYGRSPHGERGLKLSMSLLRMWMMRSRSPHGERGLKFCNFEEVILHAQVAPLTGSVD